MNAFRYYLHDSANPEVSLCHSRIIYKVRLRNSEPAFTATVPHGNAAPRKCPCASSALFWCICRYGRTRPSRGRPRNSGEIQAMENLIFGHCGETPTVYRRRKKFPADIFRREEP